jgi:hypothetical protein
MVIAERKGGRHGKDHEREKRGSVVGREVRAWNSRTSAAASSSTRRGLRRPGQPRSLQGSPRVELEGGGAQASMEGADASRPLTAATEMYDFSGVVYGQRNGGT